MKKIRFNGNIWQAYPHGLDLYPFDYKGRYIKDIVLSNAQLMQANVSEMNLKIIKLSAFDEDGKEHVVAEFKGRNVLKVKGMFEGNFLRSTSVISLGNGSYRTLRFYLGTTENSFVYSDRSEKPVFNRKYLDFDIENGLKLNGNESPEVILRFNLVPFERRNYIKSILEFFKKYQVVTGKLANSFNQLF